MLNPPIPATIKGTCVPVRVYGTTPDGRVLIAHADGKTETTIWESLRVEPVAPGTILTSSDALKPPSGPWGPWGPWIEFADPFWGTALKRYRIFGTGHQMVRRGWDGCVWMWFYGSTNVPSERGFVDLDAARLACEAYTARVEGSPAPMPADGAPVPPTFDDAGEE